ASNTPGLFRRWSGWSWEYMDWTPYWPMGAGGSRNIFGLWIASPTHAWAGGQDFMGVSPQGGTFFHFDGSTWTRALGLGFSAVLRTVWGRRAHDIGADRWPAHISH